METLNKKYFYKKMLLIGIPVVAQNLISMGLNLIDTLMIGKLGEEQVAAVGAANQVYFLFTVMLFGLYSGAAIFTAQYWGAKDIKSIRKILGIDYSVGFGFATVVSVVSFIAAPSIIDIFSDDPAVIGYGTDYLRTVCFSYIITSFSFTISYNSRAIQNLMIPTIINATALCINAVLNYILIFGKLGLEPMGVEGAAVATFIARTFEMLALLTYVYTHKNHPFNARPKELLSFGKAMFVKVMRTAITVVATEGSWALSVSLIFAAYGMLGTAALAVAQVANVFNELMQSVFFGVGNATAMIIGETLGQKDKERAFAYGQESLKIVYILDVVITLFLILMSKPIAGFYDFRPETTGLLVITIITMALLTSPKMLAYIYIVGILRSGGDTLFCMKLEIACNLIIQVSLAYVAVLVLKVSLPWAMVLVELGDIVRIAFCVPRFKSKKWINFITD